MPPPHCVIRPAQVADLEAVASLAIALGRQHAGYAPHRFRLEPFASPTSLAHTYRDFFVEQLARPDVIILVADAERRIVGYTFGRLEGASFLDLCPPSGWLHDLYLDPNVRGRGLGGQLLDATLTQLRDLGADLLMLSASPRNESACRLFASRGFAPTMTEYSLPTGAPGLVERLPEAR
jgi:GNAT superfamily N-acetyltransferase